MNPIMKNYLSELRFGEVQYCKNMAVIPLFSSINHSPAYLTLREALEKKVLSITEVSSGGSVPELKVSNQAEIPVLLLEGEELVGAKQNRTLNTTILLKEKSETLIPVSCTEQGRWSYVSKEFFDPNILASASLRVKKMQSVDKSLQHSLKFHANQSEVWEEIHKMSEAANTFSPTHAMSFVFSSKNDELEEYLKAFDCVPHQKGLFVFINGEIKGFDIISLESAYKKLHSKLVKSYAMDALLAKNKNRNEASINDAEAFLEEAIACEERKYDSIGHGCDYRYQGKTSLGFALVYDQKVIHTAFFKRIEDGDSGRKPGYRRHIRFMI